MLICHPANDLTTPECFYHPTKGMWLYKKPHNSAIFDQKSRNYMRYGNYTKRSFNWDQPEICSFSRLEMRAYRRLITSLFCPSDGTTTPPQEKRHGQKAPSLTFFPLFFRRWVVNSELITRELERGHVAQVKQPIYNTCTTLSKKSPINFQNVAGALAHNS